MRNRWFHSPLLHTPSLGLDKKATWLELFYDLIFVASFIQLGNALSHHVSLAGTLAFAGVFVPLWVAWTGFTFYENRFTVDDFTHRAFVLLQMFSVGAMAISAPGVLEGKTRAFSLSAAVAQLMVAVMYFRSMPQVPESADYARYWGVVFGVGAGLWAASAVVPAPWCYGVWAVASLAVLAAPLSKHSRALAERYPLDFEHLSERYGLLTIIVLGESFVKVLSSLTADGAGVSLWLESGVALLITVSIWWIYFDDIADSHIRRGRAHWIVWLYSHIPLQIAITAVGVGVKKAVHFGLDGPAPDKYRWLLCGALALIFFSVALIDSVTERRQAELGDRARINARALSGILVLVLAPASGTLDGAVFVALLAAVCVSQVIFDMMMAPFEAAEHLEIGHRTTATLDREASAGSQATERPRRDVAEAIHKGAPSSLRRDLYFYLMEGPWARVFVVFAFLYLVSNVFFAALYSLEPGCIVTRGPHTFLESFFFSVQTMSTIGYGAMNPLTPYGDAIVTAEAAFGMLGVALATGLIFAKVSRPVASVLFSDSLVVTQMHGEPVLSFRVGNARGNDIADATLTMTVVKRELSPEGHHLRRLHDLQLVRARNPLFVLTWTVMHRIDERSPLYGCDWEDLSKDVFSFIVTMTGHDSTYAQTVYARHTYRPQDVRVGHRFVDVISQLEDGRLMIDYDHFHGTEPDPEPPKPGAC
jgi:inward rectifier potassium channel